jgi:hypothetical protein
MLKENKEKQKQQQQKIAAHRVITMLNRKELDFMDKLGKDALFSTGHKLTHNEILKSLINFVMELDISGEKIDSIDTLKEKIKAKMQGEPKKQPDSQEGGGQNG